MQKNKSLAWNTKNKAEDEVLIGKSKSQEEEVTYSLRLAKEISLFIIFDIPCKTSLFVLQNHAFFSFLLFMDPVCFCSVVSFHFIVLSDLSPISYGNI